MTAQTSRSETVEGLAAPVVDDDLYDPAVQGNLHAYAAKWRALAPVVWMSRYNVYYVTGFDLVRQAFNNWQDFNSVGGIGLIDNRTLARPQGRNVLVGSDPPDHTRHRAVLTKVMMPGALKRWQDMFDRVAGDLVGAAVRKGTFDAVSEVIRPFTETVLPDVVGIPKEGRYHMRLLGDMTLNSVGPVTEQMRETMEAVMKAGTMEWVKSVVARESLTPDGVGAEIWTAVDRGEIEDEEARMLITLFLFGGLDTTITSLSNGVKDLLDYPDQWDLLSGNPDLAKNAYEEVLRFTMPVQQSYRVAARDLVLGGYRIEKGSRIGLSAACANRDPAEFPDPDRFDIQRKMRGHLGFSTGIHNCAGQILARMEVGALLRAMASRIRTLKPAGPAVRWVVAGLASRSSIPVTVEGR
ncbi:MAG: cytochrome P450 [Proteobacteria bacterium]|nr:cytochrome P450 [Pseudomonadota bacterium]